MKRLTLGAALFFASLTAHAAEVTVMISGGFSAALDKLAPKFEAATGDTLRIVHGPSMGNSAEAIPHRLAQGQPADAVIMVGYALDKLQQAGNIAAGSRTELADSRIGLVVRQGTLPPDIHDVPALKATLLKAKSIAYSDSASGHYVESELFNRLGITKEVQSRAKRVVKTPVAEKVAAGEYDVGLQQVSELLPVKGATFVGRIPEQVQYVTRFAGAVVSGAAHQDQARQLLHYLASPQAQAVIRETGLDPLTTAKAETGRQ